MNLDSLMNLIGFTGKAHGTPPTPECVSDDGMPDDPAPAQGSFRAGFIRYVPLSASPICPNLGRRLVLLLPLLALLAGMLSLSDAPPVSADHSSSGAEQTILSATLTVQNLGGGALGCSSTGTSRCALTSILTEDDFSYLSVMYTVTTIRLSSGTFDITFNEAIPPRLKRKLTVQVGNRKFPPTDASFTTNDTIASWTNTGLTWTANQQVPLRLTLGGPHWTGVVLQSASFIPSNERGVHDLLVAEGDSATFGIRLSKQPTANVTIDLGKSYMGWQEHGDINAATVSPTILTFTPGNYSTFQSVTVTGVADDDSDHEHLSLKVQVSSSDADYGSVDGFEYVFVTVSDDGGEVQVGAWPAFGREAGNGQTRNVPVTVWLSRSSTAPVWVSYRTANGTARAGQDYAAVNGTLAFLAGETRKTVNIPIRDDNVEDSGETFYVVLSNPQGTTLVPNYGRALVTILNDEAHLDGLSAEGAAGAGGPWAKLDLGAFAAETTDYAVTVPHGTTYARLTAETGDEDMTVTAGAGSDLTRVRSGEAGPAVALAVGDNVLVVKTTAGTGLHETYTVTVTREASQQSKPELSAFVKQYDANDNGLIDLLEYAQAGQDYGNKVITFEQFTEVKNAWLESQKYADQIAELPAPEPVDPEPSRGAAPQNVKIVPGDGQLSVSWEVGSRDGVEDSDILHAIRWRQNPGPGKWENTHPAHVLPKDGHLLSGGVTRFVIKGRQNDVAADVHIRAFTGGNYYDHAETSSEWLRFKGVETTPFKPNRAPTVANAIPDATIANQRGTKRVALSSVFADADGDSLTLTAKTSADGVATVSVAADYSSLTVTAKSRGTATITITAGDGETEVSDTFTVTVKAAPAVASSIADIGSLIAGTSQEVALTSVFSDADNDTLTLSASSSATAVATVSVATDSSKLTITGVAEGTATITVTARDSDGNSVSDAFDVTVVKVNSAPTVASAIDDVTIVNESGTSEVSLSGVFTDADSDSLTVTTSSSDEKVATVSVSTDQAALTVTAKKRGTATITVTAKDGNGGSVEDSFTVTVKAAPVVASAIADVSELAVDATHEVSLSGVFSDADADSLTVTAGSSKDAVATVSVAADQSGLTLTGKAAGTATITVTAQDSDGNSASDAFDVTVIKANSAPTVASAISDATIINESGTKRVSLSSVFTDAGGDSLTITAVSSSTSVATVSVSADYSSLTLTAKARGTTTITVTASDGNGGSVEDSFTVTVKAAPVVASAIADISELAVDATHEISLSGVFKDADGGALTLSAVSSSSAVVHVSSAIDPSTGSATAITVTGVAEGTATVTVTARDTDGNSVSDAFDVTVPAVEEQQSVELPGPVVSLALTASAEDSVTVSWSAPDTGGAPDGYIVHIKRKGGGYQDTRRPGTDRTTVSFSSLDPGRTYEVWARAQNETGKGERVSASITLPQSEDPEDNLPAVLPGPVAGLELTADGNTLTVSWSAPETGGAPDGYIVHISPEDGGKGRTKTPKAMKTQVTFKNLDSGRTYAVWVRAENEAGKGERVHATVTLPEQGDVQAGQ